MKQLEIISKWENGNICSIWRGFIKNKKQINHHPELPSLEEFDKNGELIEQYWYLRGRVWKIKFWRNNKLIGYEEYHLSKNKVPMQRSLLKKDGKIIHYDNRKSNIYFNKGYINCISFYGKNKTKFISIYEHNCDLASIEYEYKKGKFIYSKRFTALQPINEIIEHNISNALILT